MLAALFMPRDPSHRSDSRRAGQTEDARVQHSMKCTHDALEERLRVLRAECAPSDTSESPAFPRG